MKISDVELYISQFSPKVRQRLLAIRAIGFDVFGDADERIYHRVPTFSISGTDILNYGAYKDHITLWIGYNMVSFLKNIYPQFNYTKVAMKIFNDDDFPDELIREICELLIS